MRMERSARIGILGLGLILWTACNQIDATPEAGAGADPSAALLARAESGEADAQRAAGRFYVEAAVEAEGAERARRESEALR